jgi:hypothetical protein
MKVLVRGEVLIMAERAWTHQRASEFFFGKPAGVQ